ncbi:MAG: hypothetical protein IPP14_04915 [Planctomycetes bacterium]|nr:hypothetical protein [Planctomycetota bacterium]
MNLQTLAARQFGLRAHPLHAPPAQCLPLPAPGTITALLGDSGAGKSRALVAMALANPPARTLTAPPDLPVPQLFDGLAPQDALRTLAACGLADGRLWALRSSQLSAGEQQRLALALALCGAPPGTLLLADEWDCHLDADSARALAENLHRLARARQLRVVVTTHNPQRLPWLAPARVFRLAGRLQPVPVPAPRHLADELTFTPGRLSDWAQFAPWHYLGTGRPGPTAAVWLARLHGQAVGLALFAFPLLLLGARRGVLPASCETRQVLQQGATELNRQVRALSRIVVDPRLRGCGVAGRLLRFALPRLEVPFVECLAQMGEYSGFLHGAGFERAGTVAPPRAVLALRQFLATRNLDAQALLDPAARAQACADCPGLSAKLSALLKSRIETGHGSLRRGSGGDADAALTSALSRLHAAPAYFLWRRHV